MKLAKTKSYGAFQAGPIVKGIIGEISVLAAAGKLVDAEAKARELHNQVPGRADVNDVLSLSLVDQKKYGAAVPFAEAAVKAEPHGSTYLVNLGRLYLDLEMIEDALPVLERAVACRPSPFEASWALAAFFFRSGKAERSIDYFEKALATADAQAAAQIRLNYFDALSSLGRIAEAENAARPLLDDPGSRILATIRIASLRKHTVDSAILQQLLPLEGVATLEPDTRARLFLEIGKIYDNSKAYDEAFRFFTKAKAERKWSGSNELFAEEVNAQIRAFAPDVFTKYAEFGNPSDQPVFVVGMPRSGTTLTEQIIAAHPEAGGAGELNRMNSLFRVLAGSSRPEALYNVLEWAGPKKWSDVSYHYLRLINHLCPEKSRIVDKMPHNFMVVGFLALCFPNARIVHVFRNPADNFISAYQNHMNLYHGYSFDQVTYAKYYLQYMRLMDHWKSILPGKIHDLSYDQLVQDPEPVARSLIEFVGLEWSDECLKFHEKSTTVRTFSKYQVRTPINSSSLARWRNYEKHLGPLLEVLAENT